MNEPTLNLKDIHLPEPISWWPLAPGWWFAAALIIALFIVFLITKKIHQDKQLNRDIATELENIKQQFSQSQNKRTLAISLSILLRRVSISYQPAQKVAGLTGDHWLTWLDNEQTKSNNKLKFQSEMGKVLLKAPYLSEGTALDFDAHDLIQLCESWLLTSRSKPLKPS